MIDPGVERKTETGTAGRFQIRGTEGLDRNFKTVAVRLMTLGTWITKR